VANDAKPVNIMELRNVHAPAVGTKTVAELEALFEARAGAGGGASAPKTVAGDNELASSAEAEAARDLWTDVPTAVASPISKQQLTVGFARALVDERLKLLGTLADDEWGSVVLELWSLQRVTAKASEWLMEGVGNFVVVTESAMNGQRATSMHRQKKEQRAINAQTKKRKFKTDHTDRVNCHHNSFSQQKIPSQTQSTFITMPPMSPKKNTDKPVSMKVATNSARDGNAGAIGCVFVCCSCTCIHVSRVTDKIPLFSSSNILGSVA
jgi:hypothetical protein